MSQLAQKTAQAERRKSRRALSREERQALRKLRSEARKAGATLATDGEGGVPPSQALGVFRRCGWKCLRCGGRKMLSLHHKGHLENPSPRMRRLWEHSEKNDPRTMVSMCEQCHNAIHDEDREES